MRIIYHEELAALSSRLVEMTGLVRSAMARASAALLDADLRLAEEVIIEDARVDEIRAEIEHSVFDLMACQQPVARDLRQIITALRMSGDLERMGDLAVHIAQTAHRRHPGCAVPPRLHSIVEQMAQLADDLAGKAENVIATNDVQLGRELKADDKAMDRLHRRLLSLLLSHDWEHGVETAVDISLVGRYFERFGDHAVELAANVIYLVTGQHPDQINDQFVP